MAAFDAVMVAPGMAEPELSVMAPLTEANWDCPKAMAAEKNSTHVAYTKREILNVMMQ